MSKMESAENFPLSLSFYHKGHTDMAYMSASRADIELELSSIIDDVDCGGFRIV